MEEVIISAEESLRITQALGRMPYLPGASFYRVSGWNGESLARTLECFAEELTRIGKENTERENDLRALRRDVESIRRVFGCQRVKE
jgi:hypothetical protein